MKKYSLLMASALVVGICALSTPTAQASDEDNIAIKNQELDVVEQELNQREQEVREIERRSLEEQRYQERKKSLKARDNDLDRRERAAKAKEEVSYGEKVGKKALSGLSNMGTAPWEIPKNIINTVNESNIALGVPAGAMKGILNMTGRLFSGLADLVTAPLITKPIVSPGNIWEDFDVDSDYGQIFRLDNNPERFPHVGSCNIYLDPPCD